TGKPHQRHIRGRVYYRSPPGLDDLRDRKSAGENGAVEVKLDCAPEFVQWHVNNRGIPRGGAARIIVGNMQGAKGFDRLAYGSLDAIRVRYICLDRDRLAACLLDFMCGAFG